MRWPTIILNGKPYGIIGGQYEKATNVLFRTEQTDSGCVISTGARARPQAEVCTAEAAERVIVEFAPASFARAGTSTVRPGSSTATQSNLFDDGLQKQTNVLGSKTERIARLRRVLGFQSISATVMGMGDIYIQPNCKHCIAHMQIIHKEHGQIIAYCPVCKKELKIGVK